MAEAETTRSRSRTWSARLPWSSRTRRLPARWCRPWDRFRRQREGRGAFLDLDERVVAGVGFDRGQSGTTGIVPFPHEPGVRRKASGVASSSGRWRAREAGQGVAERGDTALRRDAGPGQDRDVPGTTEAGGEGRRNGGGGQGSEFPGATPFTLRRPGRGRPEIVPRTWAGRADSGTRVVPAGLSWAGWRCDVRFPSCHADCSRSSPARLP